MEEDLLAISIFFPSTDLTRTKYFRPGSSTAKFKGAILTGITVLE